jgi:hypothetical protein
MLFHEIKRTIALLQLFPVDAIDQLPSHSCLFLQNPVISLAIFHQA